MRSHAKAASAPSTHRENRAFSLGVIAAMLVCAAAFLGIGAPAASAAPEAGPGFAFKGSFGSGGFVPLVFEAPRTPVALDSSGNIFAADQLLETVYIFKADEATGGESLTQVSVGGMPRNIAIDQSTDSLYVDYVSGSVVKRWTSDGSPTPTYTLDPSFEAPQGDGIAVDPTTGDLLVADPGAEAVRRYDSSGTPVKTISTPSINSSWLLVLPDGSFYVASAAGPDLTHFSGSGTVLGTIAGVGSLHGLSYDPGRNLIVASVGSKLVTYSPAGERLAESGANSGAGIGTAVSPSSRLYEHTSEAINFYAPAVVPGVEAPTVSNVESFGIHVEAEVDPGEKEGGGLPDGSVVHFEYRLTGDSDWTPTPDQPVTAPGSYGADIALEPNRGYEVRAVASNADISNASAAVNVTTPVAPPKVETRPASEAYETSAVINGKINPFGLQTTYYFEYGPTTAYGTRIPAGTEATAGQGRVDKFFSRTIFGLTPGTTYHFRLVATNSAGTTVGSDGTFTTNAASTAPARAYEQVTPNEKHGVAIESGFGGQAAADGNAFTYVAKAGPNSSAIMPRLASYREGTDWRAGVGTDPPLAAANFTFLTHPTIAVSSDFTHALVASNRDLAPGGIEQGGNLYRLDLISGTYELVGSSALPNTFNSFVGSTTNNVFHAGAPDLSWIIFFSRNPLLPGAPNFAMYRWSETDGLEVVSLLPNGEPAGVVKGISDSIFNYVAEDGSRIYYNPTGEEIVYMREDGGPATPISVSHVPGDPTTPRAANLLGATKDGRYAFITSKAKLTADAPGELGDLYRYDANDGSLEYLGTRAFIELLDGPDGRISNNGSLGIGADGETIYFNRETSAGGDFPMLGPFSVWHEGVTHTILPYNIGGERPSPNGRYFVFSGTVGGVGGVIQLYDAETEEVSCVSCRSDGTPASARLPNVGGGDITLNNRYPQAVADDGTVYFDTAARLVSADVNGTVDVYTWRNGVLTLISPGNAPFDARYSDATADGSNIFFATSQKLVGRDNDQSYDIYDARVGGGLPAQSPPPSQECLRDDCKPTPSAGPELPFGGSEALSGPGNVKPAKKKVTCGKGKRRVKVKGKVKCVKKHKAGTNKKGGNR